MSRRSRFLIVLVALVIVAGGIGLYRYLRYVDFLNHYACSDGGGDWIDGRCQHRP